MATNLFAAGVIALALALVAAALWAFLRPPRAPAPSPGDCALITVARRALHTEIRLPANAFEPGSPLRRIYPDAAGYAVGWGDGKAFPGGLGVWTSVRALAWPTDSVVHVVALDEIPVEDAGGGVPVAVSGRGLSRLAGEIEAAFQLDEDGAPIVVGPGKLAGRSVFARGQARYHALKTCNVWTARRLDTAGAPLVWPGFHVLPWTLTGELALRAPARCEAGR